MGEPPGQDGGNPEQQGYKPDYIEYNDDVPEGEQ